MKTHYILASAGLFVLFVLSACTAAATPPTPTPDYAAEARARMDQYAQAILKMDSQAIVSLYLPDGAAYDNGNLQAQGPDAILKFMKSFDGVVRVDKYQAVVTSAQVKGDTVTLTGTYQQEYTLLANNKTGKSSGNFTAEWVRQADGKWLIRKLETRE
jgi:uncharacterized protein (TIGR02246 family)